MQSDHEMTTAALAAVLSPKSAWDAAQVVDFMRGSLLPLRVATLDADGFPHITSLWFHLAVDRLFCCTQQSALAARHLKHNAQVGFELAVNHPPYHGLSGQGTATIVAEDAGAWLDKLTAHYLEGRDPGLRNWLLSRIATEVVIEIVPLRMTGWDFRRRMASAK